MIRWRFASFEELTPRELHDLLQLRAAVFVVEQKCAFQDVDGVDPQCWHLLGYSPSPSGAHGVERGAGAHGVERGAGAHGVERGAGEGQLITYSRLVPPGIKYTEPSIGRVVCAPAARRTGCGRALMRESLERAARLWPGRAIRIGAQQYLEKFYGGYGFVTVSAPYDDEGVPHIEMVRPAAAVAERVT